jgi:hypothetical protein
MANEFQGPKTVPLIERNAELHTELKSWKEDIKEIGNRSTDAMRQGNWNEQYSRKKNVKIGIT